ncbi:MAG TPA: hypothetical protein VKM72_12225 [Thermoanaerobaculia bacterium]|nr:hypothetical protein [Thermoanaerobaculia bacterium]
MTRAGPRPAGPGTPVALEWTASATFGHSMDLWGFEKTERIGGFRWENSLQIATFHYDYPFSFRSDRTDARLTTGLAFRNAWGVLRLRFTYVDNLRQDYELQGFP